MRKRKLTKKRKRTKGTKRLKRCKRSKRLKRKNIVGGSSEAGQVEMNPIHASTCRRPLTKGTLNWGWNISNDNIRRQQSKLKRASKRWGKNQWEWLKNYSIPREEFKFIIDSIYRKYMISDLFAQDPDQVTALGRSVLESEIGPAPIIPGEPPTINEIIHILQGIKIKD